MNETTHDATHDATPTAMPSQPLRFYQKGTFTVGNRLVSEAERAVQASIDPAGGLNQ